MDNIIKIYSGKDIKFQANREGREFFILKGYRKGTVIDYNTVPDSEVKIKAENFPNKMHYLETMIERLYTYAYKKGIMPDQLVVKAMFG